METYISKNEQDTIDFAEKFASSLSNGDIVVLTGELGSGKTKFVQGVLKHFGLENEISSPTFTIVNEYNSDNINIYHFDLYRLADIDEFYAIGGEEYLQNGICIFEWGEMIEDILKKYIKPFIGGTEFLNNKLGEYTRYCLYFKNGNPSDYANIKEISDRLKNIKELREKSSADRIKNTANYPYLFCQDRQPESDYLVFPQHTTSKRKYIPIGFMSKDVIVGNACYMIPNITKYEFGVLTSNVHMAWTKVVCGRLGEGYRYSPAIYNNFPWCNPTEEQKKKVEKTAQAILDARALYPNSSLADLYDELTMPKELRKAHQENDKAVMEWEILKVKELSNVEVICIADIGDIPSAINIVIDTSYDGKYITKLFRDLDARLLRERGYDADYKCADK